MEISHRRIQIFDTTLRDGEQSPGCSMNLEEKIEVARQLERLKVNIIEAGFAASSKGDFESVKAISSIVQNATIASLSRALESDIDSAYQAVKGAVNPLIHTFIASSPIHMEYKLKKSPEEVLEQAIHMVKYAKKLCSNVEFSAEDAMRSDPQFLAKVVRGVINAGATVVNIPDTVGYATPDEVFTMIDFLMKTVDNIDRAVISVHCHNDLGMAAANSLAGIKAGATQVECTINGLGERAGNAALEEIVMAIETRKNDLKIFTGIDTKQIYRTSRLVYSTIGVTPPINKSIVGKNAFLHESGIHQHGIQANSQTYEIITPESIGLNENKMILGKHSGRHAFCERLIDLGFSFESEQIDEYFAQFKQICDKKKEVTEKDLIAIVSNSTQLKQGVYKLDKFDVHAGKHATATCVITLTKDDETIQEVALGDGPIDAAFNAIDKITKLPEHSLENYSIHSISEGKDALGEVIVKIKFDDKIITGRGLSTDIIEASILAYINGMNKLL